MVHTTLKAPMTSIVLKILVSPQQSVHKGEQLLILEAMKMETVIRAETAGMVQEILTTEGTAVLIKGTTIATRTDREGNFSISSPPEGSITLVVSYIGFPTMEVTTQKRSAINIKLRE